MTTTKWWVCGFADTCDDRDVRMFAGYYLASRQDQPSAANDGGEIDNFAFAAADDPVPSEWTLPGQTVMTFPIRGSADGVVKSK